MLRAPSFARLAAACVWALAGCSLVVSGDPTVRCESDQGCPSSQRCAVASGACIDRSEACSETGCSDNQVCSPDTLRCVAGAPRDDASEVDAGEEDATDGSLRPDTGPDLLRIGEACASQTDCARILVGSARVSGICATRPLSGFDTDPFCTTPCCKSDQCPDGFFCDHGPAAGRYCVPFGKDTRDPPSGNKVAGATCSASSECATGLCAALEASQPAEKVCIDTCCRDLDCGNGLVCGFREGPPLQWVCRPPRGEADPSESCIDLDDCVHGACFGDSPAFCSISCCSNASCAEVGLSRCVSASMDGSTSSVNLCAQNEAGGNADAPCINDADCQSGICVGAACASTCCTDTDCSNQQRCVADGNEARPHCARVD